MTTTNPSFLDLFVAEDGCSKERNCDALCTDAHCPSPHISNGLPQFQVAMEHSGTSHDKLTMASLLSTNYTTQDIDVSCGAYASMPTISSHHKTTPKPVQREKSSSSGGEAAKRERQRQQSQIHQLRHRLKKRKIVTNLEEGIRSLRDEIQQLVVQSKVLSLSVTTNTTIWNIASEYFRLFRNGVRDPVAEVDIFYAVQRKFLRETMAPDVIHGTTCGVDSLLGYWKLISLYHDDINVQLVCLKGGETDSLIAITKISLSITENTLRYAFPHLIRGDGREEWPPLAAKLLGRSLLLHGSVCFDWDAKQQHVTRLQHSADMVTPLLGLVGNLQNVSRMFNNAFITPEFWLPDARGN